MRTSYQCLSDPDDVIYALSKLAPRTVVVDVEPLIAVWNSGQSSLNRGAAYFLERVYSIRGLSVICFATNSRRRLTSAIGSDGQNVHYIASACKPLRTVHYRDFPEPGIVVGDQVATDGVLAWRLKYSFIHYHPNRGIPIRPTLMRYLGYAIHPLLFRPCDNDLASS